MIDLIIDVEKGISFSNLTDQEAVDVDGNVAKDVNGMEVTNASVSELRLINNDNSYMIRWQGEMCIRDRRHSGQRHGYGDLSE